MLHHHFSSSRETEPAGFGRSAPSHQAGQTVSAATIGLIGGIAGARAHAETVAAPTPLTVCGGR
jgi:hypothetical protein